MVVRMKETSSNEQEKNQLMLINRNAIREIRPQVTFTTGT